MAVIQCRRAVGGDSYGDNLRQIVKLERGTYGMMLARYTLPKLVQKYNSPDQEEKIFVSFVVTHDRTNEQLPHFSEAFVGLRPTLFYDSVAGKMSNYVALVHALTGGKIPHEQIAPASDTVEPYELDWDELIGRPILGYIEPATKADKHGLFGNRLKSVEPPDKSLQKAIRPLWEAKKTATSDNGLLYLTFPAPAYQDDANATVATNGAASSSSPADDEIPW